MLLGKESLKVGRWCRMMPCVLKTFFHVLTTAPCICVCHVQALNKKEHRGCESPDADASYVLTPSTEEKYKKINEEFDNMMKSHKIVSEDERF